jgi:SAM-dependent methyltransferase
MGIKKDYDENYFISKKYDRNRKHKIQKSKWLIQIGLGFHPDAKCLFEAGCSLGNTLEAAKDFGIDHLGIDVSHYAVEYCIDRGLNASNKTIGEVLKSGIRYDFIFLQHILEHFPDLIQVLKQCHDLLSNDGIVLILVPNSKYFQASIKLGEHRFYSINGVGPEHYVYFDYKSLTKVLSATGFNLLQKNYPLFVRKPDSIHFFISRIFRRFLSLINFDQEILVIARKKNLEYLFN